MIHNYMNLQVYKCTMERLLCSVWNSSACNAEKLLGYGRRCGGTFYFGFPGGKVCKIQLFLYVLMLMVLLCICGDGGASSLREKQGNSEPVTEGRKLKFPEPGIYESAEEFEEVITTEYGYSGFLASYDYPYYNYWDGDLYHYLLVADEGQIIELSFEEPFEIEYSEDCQYDALIVRDGRYGYSPPLARLCGHEAPPKVVSTGRYMSILFTTDEEVNGVGFFANYSFIDDPKTEKNISKKECHFNVGGSTPRTLSGFDGLIYSENGRKFVRDGAGNENDTIDCTWEINMPEYYKIMIEFDNFKLADVNECDKNRVEVYDLFSYNVEERMIRTYCSTTAPTLMTVGNRAFIHFYAQSKGNVFNVLYTAYRDVHKTDESSGAQMDDADNGCNKSVSFGCAEHMCIDYSLRCNGRKNCWNFGYDELDCKKKKPQRLLDGKIDSVLGVTMGIIIFVTVLTIVLTCRQSCVRTREKAHMMEKRRKAERQAVTYMMDNKEGADSHEMTTFSSDRYKTQYIRLGNIEPQNGGVGRHPSLTPTNSATRSQPLTEYENLMYGDLSRRDGRPEYLHPPWVPNREVNNGQYRPVNGEIQIHV
ncbi:uncharacterized protein [Amphiura filiformis]|uniref:uncharacterized protein isoform X2 n=1 Tax=Amphiura filiformis TaxID=82378 RepID=UPI003B228715